MAQNSGYLRAPNRPVESARKNKLLPSMIAEYIRYQLPSDQTEALEQAYQRAGVSLNESPHCRAYELARCTDDPNAYILRIEWDSHEGHLKGFRSSAEFKRFYQEIAPYVPYIQEMRHYDLTDVVARKA
jgi:hemoglobin